MHKCLKIMFDASVPDNFLYEFVQQHAKDLGLEGTVQVVSVNKKVRIVVCGDKDTVDEFVDLLHKGTGKFSPDNIEVEAFAKDKSYRGVFRVIE